MFGITEREIIVIKRLLALKRGLCIGYTLLSRQRFSCLVQFSPTGSYPLINSLQNLSIWFQLETEFLSASLVPSLRKFLNHNRIFRVYDNHTRHLYNISLLILFILHKNLNLNIFNLFISCYLINTVLLLHTIWAVII